MLKCILSWFADLGDGIRLFASEVASLPLLMQLFMMLLAVVLIVATAAA
jgi:hypothetical protein